jgi:hypothetical protein
MIVTVHAKPRAKKDDLVWLDDTTAKVSVREAPEKGKANERIIDLLSEHLHIAKSLIHLIRGSTTRMKQFEIKR